MSTSTTCTRCGKAIAPGEEKMGQPVISAGEFVKTALKNPSLLSGPPLPDVPYCAECRPLVAKERTRAQMIVLLGIIGILALIAVLLVVI